jgi:hypothetical protein
LVDQSEAALIRGGDIFHDLLVDILGVCWEPIGIVSSIIGEPHHHGAHLDQAIDNSDGGHVESGSISNLMRSILDELVLVQEM